VADPAAGKRFYSEFLGLAVTQRACSGALFFTAGAFRTVQGDLLLRAVQNYALEVSSFWNRVTSNLISSQPSIAPSDSGDNHPDWRRPLMDFFSWAGNYRPCGNV
jgi:hypothetical protein